MQSESRALTRYVAPRRSIGTYALVGAAVSTSVLAAVGPLVLAMLVAAATAVFAVRASAAPMRRLIAAERVASQKRARRVAREERLPIGGFGRGTLAELTRRVDDIMERDPELAERLDLESLLDRHVTLTIAHDHALCAARMADRAQLERIRESYLSDAAANPRRLEMCERRLACLADCQAKAEWFADELAILSDLIALIGQRAACPEDLLPDDTIERGLAELDDGDAARRQLAELQ